MEAVAFAALGVAILVGIAMVLYGAAWLVGTFPELAVGAVMAAGVLAVALDVIR